jgi:hypothetical protein
MRARAVALALLLMSAGVASATDQAWLLGRWEMTRDPDGGAKDWLEFATDGRVISTKPDGQRLTGRYLASESEVQINFKVGTLSVIVTLAADADKQHLYAKSARTGNTAVYEKRP